MTEENTATVESAYLSALAALEAIFQKRDYILGDKPTQADFGFMGPMFRHFFCDPKPARVMRDTAPAVQEWVARMWNSNPQRFSNAAPISSLVSGLNALIEPVTSAYLPYLRANELAVNAEQAYCNYNVLGSDFSEPAKPYRLWCLDQLRIQYQGLDAQAKRHVDLLLDEPSIALLSMEKNGSCDYLIPALPIKTKCNGDAIYDSWGRTPDVNENPL